ncbi:MAG: class I SAM-dependent methyltransferase [Lysobacterales bacterium]
MDFNLRQRGRASIDFAADVTAFSGQLHMAVGQRIADVELPEDFDAQLETMHAELADDGQHYFGQAIGKWSGDQHGVITHDAFKEIQAELEPEFDRLRQGGTQIETREGFQPPDYWEGVDFHRTTGGWVREHQGFVHGELIHPKYVAKNFPGGIFKQRREVLNELGDTRFENILEMGTSSGHFTIALAEAYPDAHLTGIDPGLPMLEQAQRFGNERGLSWRLIQANAENTGLDDNSFDLVTSYIMLHELPAAATRQIFAEALRVLQPGGTMMMSDVPPFRALPKLAQWRANAGAERGGEPYWREAASLDLAELATEVGFENARSYGIGERQYPWVTIAQKPAA